MQWVEKGNPAVAVYTREYQDESLLILNNLSDSLQMVSFPADYRGEYLNLISNTNHKIGSTLAMQPYTYLWLKEQIK